MSAVGPTFRYTRPCHIGAGQRLEYVHTQEPWRSRQTVLRLDLKTVVRVYMRGIVNDERMEMPRFRSDADDLYLV